MTVALYIVGGICWGSLVVYFTWTALHDRKPRPRPHHSPLILLFAEERRRRYRKALKRAGYVELQGHPRLGIDKARHIR